MTGVSGFTRGFAAALAMAVASCSANAPSVPADDVVAAGRYAPTSLTTEAPSTSAVETTSTASTTTTSSTTTTEPQPAPTATAAKRTQPAPTTTAAPPTTEAPVAVDEAPLSALPPVDAHERAIEIARSVTDWPFEANGVKIVIGMPAENRAAAWAVYVPSSRTVFLNVIVLASPGVASRYIAHEIAHAYVQLAMSPGDKANFVASIDPWTDLPIEDALADCVAVAWGQPRGVYWSCESGSEDGSVAVLG